MIWTGPKWARLTTSRQQSRTGLLQATQVVLLLKSDDQIFAVGNQCTHQGAGARQGRREDRGIGQDRDLPGSRKYVQPRDRQGDEAAGFEAGRRSTT